MESTTPLALYLEKLAAGDRDLAPIICQKLSQQLVYVPVISGGKSKSDGKLTFQVVKLPEGSVPVFTTERQYKDWAAQNPQASEVFTVLGGDLCATVGERATVMLDIGAAHSSVLDAALMRLIAAAARETLGVDRTLRIDGGKPPEGDPLSVQPSIPPPPGAEPTTTSPNAEDIHPALLPGINAHGVLNTGSPTPQPIIDPLRGRSNPTSVMARPTRPPVDLDENSYKKRLLLDAGKPVITTCDPDSAKLIRTKEDPKKSERRSLLKFLGG